MSAHLYIHIPFCSSKCLYCDFYSVPRRNIPWGRFVEAVAAEARSRADELPSPPDTIYVGGGTPSLMPPEVAAALLRNMLDIFGEGAKEVTIELNPDDVSRDYIESLKRSGYNRFSMGVQSFRDTCLRGMGRRHTAAQALEACKLLTETTDNVSIDLIFGLPGQSWSDWSEDVATAVRLRPQHISCYSLMLEEGTPLTRLVESGRISLPSEDTSAEMYAFLRRSLADAGYNHYEISNFALSEFESRHNSAYWQSRPYLGLGPGAHSYDGLNRRRYNPSDTEGYMRRYAEDAGNYAPAEEVLTACDLRHEYLLTRLRTSRGISLRHYDEMFGEKEMRELRKALSPHLESGAMITADDDRLRIAEERWLTADSIISDLF